MKPGAMKWLAITAIIWGLLMSTGALNGTPLDIRSDPADGVTYQGT
jgi:hypothetical protein